jgi:hypothetical protein
MIEPVTLSDLAYDGKLLWVTAPSVGASATLIL